MKIVDRAKMVLENTVVYISKQLDLYFIPYFLKLCHFRRKNINLIAIIMLFCFGSYNHGNVV